MVQETTTYNLARRDVGVTHPKNTVLEVKPTYIEKYEDKELNDNLNTKTIQMKLLSFIVTCLGAVKLKGNCIIVFQLVV